MTPSMPGPLGKLLIMVGGVLVVLGLALLFADKIPWLGRLPGDIMVERKGFGFYFPLTTCVIISIVLTIVFSLLARR